VNDIKNKGFGGIGHKTSRFWLDEELETESYVHPEDDTYEKGYLVDPSITKFNVEFLGEFINKINRLNK